MMERTGRRATWMLLLGLSAMIGCQTERALRVFLPLPMQTDSTEFEIVGGKIRINLLFNRPVDLTSMIPGTNVILETPLDASANVTVSAGGTLLEAVIETVADASTLLNPGVTNTVTLRLLGSGGSPIRSTSGLTLNQNPNGDPQQDYETSFAIDG